MTAQQTDAITDPQSMAALQQMLDAALAREAALAEELAASTAALAQRNTEYSEWIEHQAATIEVLRAMSASPGDPRPVFDLIATRARDLCGAYGSTVYEFDGTLIQWRAATGVSDDASVREAVEAMYPMAPSREWPVGRAIMDRQIIHISDLETELWLNPAMRGITAKSSLVIPLMRGDVVIGALALGSRERGGFSDSQVGLLKTFAEQAVIAIGSAETYRALQTSTADLQESLEYQTATSDVLNVISRSGAELEAALDTLVQTAARLCDAQMAFIHRREGGVYRPAAVLGFPLEFTTYLKTHPLVPGRGSIAGRVAMEGRAIHITDVAVDPEYELSQSIVMANQRTALGVPLLRENEPTGVIVLARQRVQPFTDKEIALVTTFADQAVIAMENTRLLTELRARTEELARREDELRVTFDNMGDAVVMFDHESRLTAWNRNFVEILELPDKLLAQRPSYADYVRALAQRGEFGTDDVDAEVSRRLEATEEELRLERKRPDGRVIEVRRNAVPGGGFVLIYSDITERKCSEAEIRAARDAAEAALRELKAAQANLIQAEKMASLGQLTAGIAHEIKNPLNFVNNFAALSVDLLAELKDTAAPGFAALTDDQRAEMEDVSAMLTSNLEKITEHGKRADGIVKAMLEHSRGSSGERRMVNLNALIDDALNLAYHGARAQDQSFNITLERDFGDSIAPIEVNPQDMTRVFLNIFSNGFYAATRRARNGEDAGFLPTLKVTTRDAGDAVEIRVRDNGTGIPADIRDKLFQPFFTTKPTGEGTGLGLSITYDIVTQQHGGSIAVDSTVGEYSEFTMRLPRNP
jgi:two-component system, NtrC family, sensor kinase